MPLDTKLGVRRGLGTLCVQSCPVGIRLLRCIKCSECAFFPKVWISSARRRSVMCSAGWFSLPLPSCPSFGMGAAVFSRGGEPGRVGSVPSACPGGDKGLAGHHMPLKISQFGFVEVIMVFFWGGTEYQGKQPIFCRGKINQRCHVFPLYFKNHRRRLFFQGSGCFGINKGAVKQNTNCGM